MDLKRIIELADDVLGLVYPRLCAACGQEHPMRGQCLCVTCQWNLPRTDYHTMKENAMTRRLMGRFSIESATAMFYFLKDSKVQDMLHRIKYQGYRQAAFDLGRLYGLELKEEDHFKEIDIIVPVPLHPGREHQRGFNQSDWFGRGLSESMGIPLGRKVIRRIKATETQTAKNRTARLRNMTDAFEVMRTPSLKGKHVLLVDDVMTTGATLEACALALLKSPEIRISLVTLAIAQD